MYRLTDTHCHLNLNTFQDDLADVIARAREAGIYRILVPGIDIPSSQVAVQLAEAFPEIYAAVGLHPTDADQWTGSTYSQLSELARHPKVVAIGEIGLDYYHDRVSPGQQKVALLEQLRLAAEMRLPVVLHNRNSFDDLWEIIQNWLDEWRQDHGAPNEHPGVFHSFEGSLDQAKTVAQHGFCLGISGPVTYKNAAERRSMVTGLPLEYLLLETDAPFLAPQRYRGKRNEPAYTEEIGKRIAELRGMDFEKITGVLADNAARLFAWEP